MSAVAERIYRDTYERHVARARAYIDAEGLCNEIGSVIEALQIENDLISALGDEYEKLPIYQNREYAIQVLTAIMKALDLNYQNAEERDRISSRLLLIEELEGL